MTEIKKLILDVLKPHDPEIIEFTKEMCALKSVSSLESSVEEVDKEVETVQIILYGEDIVYDEVKKKVKELGASIHSVDGVVAEGDRKVEMNDQSR